MTHLVELPEAARLADTRLRWLQLTGRGCWAIDNILISNTDDVPEHLYDNFDPVEIENWYFIGNGDVKVRNTVKLCKKNYFDLFSTLLVTIILPKALL